MLELVNRLSKLPKDMIRKLSKIQRPTSSTALLRFQMIGQDREFAQYDFSFGIEDDHGGSFF